MRWIHTAPGLAALALCVFAADGFAQKRNEFSDSKNGFKIIYPSGWQIIPIKTGEEWIFAKFLCTKPYRITNERGTHEHKPMMRVLGFPHKVDRTREAVDDKGRKIKYKDNPYKNYEDYLDRHHQGGGWFFSEEKDVTVKDREALYRVIKVEKLAIYPRHILTLTFKAQDMDYVVEVDVLPNKLSSLKAKLLRSLKSFEFIAKGPESEEEDSLKQPFIFSSDKKERAKQIAARRKKIRERVLADSVKALPAGWWTKDTKSFLILSKADKKYTNKVIKQAESVRKWLEERFGRFGKGEVLKCVIRICETVDEARAYLSGSGDSYLSEDGEVVCAADAVKHGFGDDFQRVASALVIQYFNEKNDALWEAMPYWLNNGIVDYVKRAKIDRKGLSFRKDVEDFNRVKKMIEDGRMPELQEIFQMTGQDALNGKTYDQQRDYIGLSCLLTRYVFESPERKTKWFTEYMEQLLADLETFEDSEWQKAAKDVGSSGKPMTEEEEDERFRNAGKQGKGLADAFNRDRQRFLENAFKGAFGDWEDKDWKKLTRDFYGYAKK